MNQIMLEKAQKLREEASILEEANKLSEAIVTSVILPDSIDSDSSVNINGKSSREDFIGRFPVERLTPIFTLGVFNSNVTTEEVSNGTYVSVLVERDSERLRQKSQLDKISGEAVRSRNAISGASTSIPNIPMREGLKIDQGEQGTKTDRINSQLSLNSTYIRDKYKTTINYNFPFTVDKALKRVVKPNGDEGFELQTLDSYLESAVDAWYFRLIIKFFVYINLITSDEKAPGYEADKKFIELALGSIIYELFSVQKITEPNEDDFKDILLEMESCVAEKDTNKVVYYRADYLRAQVSGELPSVTDLQALIDSTVIADGFDVRNDDIYQWRLATISRLQSGTSLAREERKFLWDFASDFDVNTPVKADIPLIESSLIAAISEETIQTERLESDLKDFNESKTTLQDQNDIALLSECRVFLNLNDVDLVAARLCVDKLYERIMDEEIPMSDGMREAADNILVVFHTNPVFASIRSDKVPISMKVKNPEEISNMSYNELRTYLDLKEDSNISDVIEKYVKAAVITIDTAAERFVSEYFDEPSKSKGMILSREGAGRFQAEMLKDLFVVSSVKMCQGAVIFDGKYKAKNSAEFSEKLAEKFSSCRMNEEVEYTILMNERYPDLDKGLQQAALDQMLGRSPCVILYPKQWNSTVNSNLAGSPKKIFRSALSTLASVSSAAFAANCLDMFNPTSTYMVTGVIPDDFLPLAFLPLTIQYTSTLVETVVGRLKGFNVTSIVVPSFSLFTFGSRSIYTTLPKNRNDIFDTAAIGVSVALMYSLAALFIGLQITASATSETVATFPSVSLALLNTNAVVSQLLSYELPQLAQEIAASGQAASISTTDATVHLHWLAIAGAGSFIANTLQLIPVDNSAGSKLGQSVVGRDNFQIVSLLTGAVKFLIVFPMLFSINALSVVTAPRLLFDYFVTSQVAGNEEVCSFYSILPYFMEKEHQGQRIFSYLKYSSYTHH